MHSAFYIELGFDPAYHASVAKNWVQGYGWATSYDTRFPFNPDITTGPVMLVPAAAMIAWFGNALWVPGVTAALLHLLLFGLLLLRLRRYFSDPSAYGALVVALTLAFLIYANVWWMTLTADFLVCLALLVAATGVASPDVRGPNRDFFISGLALGVALLAKALAWFGVIALAIYALLQWQRGARWKTRRLVAFFAGLLLLVLPWKAYERVSLSAMPEAERVERTHYKTEFFLAQGSGIQEMLEAPSLPNLFMGNLALNSRLFAEHYWQRYHLPSPVLALLVLGLLAYTVRCLYRPPTPLRCLLLVLGLTASAQLAWYLLFSASWNAKYVLAPMLIGLCMLAIRLASSGRAGWMVALLMVSLLWLPTPVRSHLVSAATFRAQISDYTHDLQMTRDYLLQHAQGAPLVGCGWVFVPWEIEYALPEPQNFSDCRRLVSEALEPDGNGGYRWARPVEFRLVVSHLFWDASAYRPQFESVLRACLQAPLFRTEYFTVAHCRAEALMAHIPLDPSSEFLPPAQPRAFVHKPLPLR